ncbi:MULTISPECIES: hypothetical protein [unclassified Rhizobium]|uniref:hypothetical protein n=1 Tax=unclassified Rhizobium TaxID=2613769 RepID=UPI001621B02C|nr:MULTISPECIES: hypothetical protein [unclassified Rhizobium]MBB3545102.1 hypothetical protein [Rhizobium sp. BK399]MCS4095955.1 hypothetical protein [Rhizobium sp. BK176]
MGKMYRIALSRLLIFVRLVIIVSLAGYTLSNANAAMHGSAFPELPSPIAASGHDHSAMSHDHHGMSGHDHSMSGDQAAAQDVSQQHDHGSSTGDHDQFSKQQCCKDFCGGFGIVCEAHDVGGPVVSSIRQFVNDQSLVGELPPLYRPPNI